MYKVNEILLGVFLASPAARSSAQIETEKPSGRFLQVK